MSWIKRPYSQTVIKRYPARQDEILCEPPSGEPPHGHVAADGMHGEWRTTQKPVGEGDYLYVQWTRRVVPEGYAEMIFTGAPPRHEGGDDPLDFLRPDPKHGPVS